MSKRIHCIWCNSTDLSDFFETDYSTPIASYIEDELNTPEQIPYNVQKCNQCLSYQIKYVADPAKVYKKNHAYSYGTTLTEMCILFSDMITSSDIHSILEVGAGNGYLADKILKAKPTLNYEIIDPQYIGNRENRTIINSFIENYDTTASLHDTIVLSHVFEHFYEPLTILNTFKSMKNLKHIFLNMPNLELYVQKNTFHVLNTEHTYFVENDFLEAFFRINGFKLEKKLFFKEHSVFFHFVKTDTQIDQVQLINKNSVELIQNFFNYIKDITNKLNQTTDGNPIYMWPCSMHTQFILNFGVNTNLITALLDNSSDKIGQYLYGFSKQCLSFEAIISLNKPSTIILNGGCFNVEIEKMLATRQCDNIKFIYV
jgi:hypothetical protein